MGDAMSGARDERPNMLVYGASTCEDTAITVSRLRALGVPFAEVDVDADPEGLARVVALMGRRVTPTVVLGEAEPFAEPSIELLEERLRSSGARFRPPMATQVRGPLADRPIPLRTLDDAAGVPFTLDATRGRRATALFLAHGADCLVCHGYARQLARQADAMRDADGQAVIAVADVREAVGPWRDGMPPAAVLLADGDGAWKRAIEASLPLEGGGASLIVLDRFAAPAAISSAGDAGGLIGPEEATEWIRFLELDCPGCGNAVSWPD